MSETENTLPVIVSRAGEPIRVFQAADLFRVAGLELAVADKGDIAEFIDGCRYLEDVGKEAREIAGKEMVRRLDRDGKWTWRGGGFEVKTASPEAGTVFYDQDALEAARATLLEEDLISVDAADAALAPQYGHAELSAVELLAIAAVLEGSGEPGERDMVRQLVEAKLRGIPPTTYTQKPGGIKALLKRGGRVAELIKGAERNKEAPERKATVKRVATDS